MSIQNMETIDKQAFAERMIETLNHTAIALMTSIGHRTHLFDCMAEMPPATSEQIAEQAGLNERYVREWLGAMVTGGIVRHDPEAGTFVLPPEHSAWLTRSAVPNNLASMMQWVGLMGHVEDKVVDAFHHGKGIPYSEYHRFHEVMAEESAQTVVAGLTDHILPLVPGLMEQLSTGIEVLDVGCGSGRAMNALAVAFPKSKFYGYDLCEDAIAAARAESAHRGSTNARFQMQDMAKMMDSDRFDLITAFDAIHDQSRPDLVLENVFRALKPGGTFLMQDIAAETHLHGNLDHPIGPFIYTISCMHCMSVSLAGEDGMGLGAAWGRQKAVEMLNEAGFKEVQVEQLEHDFQNYYYICRKPG